MMAFIISDMQDILNKNSFTIGAGSILLGQVTAMYDLSKFMTTISNITTILGAIVVLFTAILKGKQLWDTFVKGKKSSDDATKE